MKVLLVALVLVASVLADPTVYFQETFEDGDAWRDRWVQSKHKSDYGEWKLTAGDFYGDAEKDKGLQTSQNARFYAIGTKFDSFSNKDKTLVVQFTVKHEQSIDCGGGYVKLFPGTLEIEQMHGESQYNIMFGPDICGPGTKKVHVIFNYKGENLLIKKDIRCKDDQFTHLYTLIVKPDNTYVVKIDNKEAQSGSLEEDWTFLKPKTIPDPEASKPEDWDDRAKIDDPEDTKPEDWDQPEYIADPDAEKPEDWDDDTDGEWEAPMIPNPEYKGEWSPKQIDNPNYQGEWVHPQIPNPEYEPNDQLYMYEDFGAIGLDLWQVKSGTIFDNFLITDDEAHAEQVGKDVWEVTRDAEKIMKDKQDEEERLKREEEEKRRKEEEEEEEEEEETDDDSDDNSDDDSDDDGDSNEENEKVDKDEL